MKKPGSRKVKKEEEEEKPPPPEWSTSAILRKEQFNQLVMRRANLSEKAKEIELTLRGPGGKGGGLNDKIGDLLRRAGKDETGAMVGNLYARLQPSNRTSFDQVRAAQELVALGVSPAKIKKAFARATTENKGQALYISDVTKKRGEEGAA